MRIICHSEELHMSTIRKLHLISAAFVVCASTLVGCLAAPAEQGDQEDAETAAAQSAFGEATCWNDAANTTTDSGYISSCGYVGTMHNSADGNYGNASCTHAYEVKYTGFAHASCHIDPHGDAALLTTSAACTAEHISLRVYDSSGVLKGTAALQGQWDSANNKCNFGSLVDAYGYNTVVIAQASHLQCWPSGLCGTVYDKVGFSLNCPTC
jgi:hypothetical protein